MTNTTTTTAHTQISAREMFVNSCHVWHKTSRWNPSMKKYLYGIKNWVHIFDLEESSKMFVELLNQVSELSAQWKTILFVSTKPQTQEMLSNIHETTWMPIVSYKWFGGLLTNFSTIKQRIALMRKLRDQFATWEISKYTKKEQSQFKKELEKLSTALWGLEKMNSIPDAVFVIDWKRDKIALDEANKLWLPVLWIMDSNTDPRDYSFWVPCNDDSVKSLAYVLWFIEESIMTSKRAPKSAPVSSDAWGVRKLK